MRKLRRDSLWLLFASEGSLELAPEWSSDPSLEPGLGYQDFLDLRPEYAASSWRVLLNKLVEERLVLKRTREGKVLFRLTRLGLERVQQTFFSGILAPESDVFTVVLLKPLSGRNSSYGGAQRILEGEGFLRLLTGVYLKPGQIPYSDFLWRSLQRQGFLAAQSMIRAADTRPVSLSELVVADAPPTEFQAKWQEFSSLVDKVLRKKEERNSLTIHEKRQFGEVIVSGLESLSLWTPFVAGYGIGRPEVQQGFQDVFQAMQVYSRIVQGSVKGA